MITDQTMSEQERKMRALAQATAELLATVPTVPPVDPDLLPPPDMPWGLTDEEESRWWSERARSGLPGSGESARPDKVFMPA